MRACPSACRPGRRGPRAPWNLRAGLIRIPGEAEVREGDASAPGDLADDSCLDVRPEGPDDAFRLLLWCNDCEAHAHVERLIHLAVFDSTERLELVEDRLRLERLRNPEFHAGFEPHEVPHAAPGDVGHPVKAGAPHRPENGSDVDCGGLEEFLTPRPPRAAGWVEYRESRLAEQPPRECEAVRMDPGARQPDDRIPGTDRPPIDHLRLAHDAEAGPGEIEIPHDLRDDRHLAADNRDVRELRASVQPDANLPGHVPIVRLDRHIVNEGEGLRADADHVVHGYHIAPKRPRLFQPYAGRGPVNMLSRQTETAAERRQARSVD